ncbi:unnamed protein product [Blepharisma stoltei]|uniref:ALA-interacting subunit n=1 Tax=Blepharisma stoltei TaxID=1481888 RepID=A0AAU9J4J7_9CILI|nr:unnamed protein product [Blepharisma stoltei]
MADGQVVPLGEEQHNRKPRNTPFRQQTMKAYKPVPTVKSAVIIFTTLGSIFIIVGSVLLSYSLEIIEHRKRYDNVGECDKTKYDRLSLCNITFDVTDEMSSTVYFYYELDNFYQNHRRYVKSKSQNQLMGNDLSKGSVSTDCDPIVTMEDLGIEPKYREGGWDLTDKDVANPCGLIAKTFFNDTFIMWDQNGHRVNILENDIAWPSDKDRKFKNLKNWQKKQWKDVEDEHFIVWMRVSGLPNFRKLWGRIEDDLTVGTYTVQINSTYDVSDFDGKKYVVISTANALGGRNDFLGIAYIVVGGITILLAIAFFVRGYFFKKSQDLHYS